MNEAEEDLVLTSMHLQALQLLYKFFTTSARFLNIMALSKGQLSKLQISHLILSKEPKDVRFALKFC